MEVKSTIAFENMYDAYSGILYGIALQISSNQRIAEQIVIRAFRKAYKQRLVEHKLPSLCITLIKLTVEAGHEILTSGKRSDFKLNPFETAQLLQQLMYGQITFENYCDINKLNRTEGAKKLREELNLLPSFKTRNDVYENPKLSSTVF